MARNEQLIRQHKILQILERVRYGKTLQELQADIVEELGLKSLHTRTLRRDLEAGAAHQGQHPSLLVGKDTLADAFDAQ